MKLAYSDALPQLAVVGVISGLITGAVAVLFRISVDGPLAAILPDGSSENFEALSAAQRFLLPFIGAIVLGLLWDRVRPRYRQVGVGHVIERLNLHQGKLPFANGLSQFFGGTIALLTGQSMGREGPAVQLGATAASIMGQKLRIPNNNLRTLVGCGAAAAISASFNTPLAGVIFAMEVILMEYTIAGFIPVMLAAISGAIFTQIIFGSAPAFSIPPLELSSLWELPWLAVCGLCVGLLAAVLLKIFQQTQKLAANKSYVVRFGVAGAITGALALFIPEIMGIGYDTLQSTMLGELSFWLLVGIAAAKMISYSVSAAVGIPAGSIGPTLVIGACVGGAFGIIGPIFNPGEYANPGFYAIIGMGAMMAAVLNAPLSALIAVLELTYNPNILLPAMLVIVIATITARTVSRMPGIFLIGRNPRHLASPVFQMLSRIGVTAQINRNIVSHSQYLPWQKADSLLDSKPDWIAIEDLGKPIYLIRPADIAHFIEAADKSEWDSDTIIDLMEIPAVRLQALPIHAGASLQETLIMMKQKEAPAAYISPRVTIPTQSQVSGIITRTDIENYYL